MKVSNLPSRLDFEMWKGDDFDVTLEIVSVSGTTETPIDFTDWTAEMVLEPPGSDTAALTVNTDAEITFPAAGFMRIQIDKDVLSDGLVLGKYDHRIKLINDAGKTKTYFAGEFKYLYK